MSLLLASHIARLLMPFLPFHHLGTQPPEILLACVLRPADVATSSSSSSFSSSSPLFIRFSLFLCRVFQEGLLNPAPGASVPQHPQHAPSRSAPPEASFGGASLPQVPAQAVSGSQLSDFLTLSRKLCADGEIHLSILWWLLQEKPKEKKGFFRGLFSKMGNALSSGFNKLGVVADAATGLVSSSKGKWVIKATSRKITAPKQKHVRSSVPPVFLPSCSQVCGDCG